MSSMAVTIVSQIALQVISLKTRSTLEAQVSQGRYSTIRRLMLEEGDGD